VGITSVTGAGPHISQPKQSEASQPKQSEASAPILGAGFLRQK